MPRLRKVSGKECVRILCNRFGFSLIRQKGSHFVLSRHTEQGKAVTVVPNHKELKPGTLKSILKLAKVEEELFSRYP